MSLFPSNASNTSLSSLTLECLTDIRQKRLRGRARSQPESYLHELDRRATALRDLAIEHQAIRFFVLYDEEALQAEFDKRLSPDDLFNIGFDFDISDIEYDLEPWAAAWQLATDDVLANPLEYPAATLEQIADWLKWQPPVKEGQRPAKALAQATLW